MAYALMAQMMALMTQAVGMLLQGGTKESIKPMSQKPAGVAGGS